MTGTRGDGFNDLVTYGPGLFFIHRPIEGLKNIGKWCTTLIHCTLIWMTFFAPYSFQVWVGLGLMRVSMITNKQGIKLRGKRELRWGEMLLLLMMIPDVREEASEWMDGKKEREKNEGNEIEREIKKKSGNWKRGKIQKPESRQGPWFEGSNDGWRQGNEWEWERWDTGKRGLNQPEQQLLTSFTFKHVHVQMKKVGGSGLYFSFLFLNVSTRHEMKWTTNTKRQDSSSFLQTGGHPHDQLPRQGPPQPDLSSSFLLLYLTQKIRKHTHLT